ncbi:MULTISPECIES: methyltransferase domain-containing protein [Roseivirga]|uniref:class I SAM-dependent methyltransferase n=1 Tax=Roseivirga TaxID=290180 RepID=UPI00257A674F|nr:MULTISPECIES: methyltransferase domain-containing protein [Roseivirga]|tara:strand:- start:6839 stop:7768 length:930 start_codon:yes stop_codon:yes gene_type:complete
MAVIESLESNFFLCPHTRKPLRFMSRDELSVLNQRIERNELYFHLGIQAQCSVDSALITENQTYVYPIVEGIIFLKKDVAITAKNRTKNPFMRVPEHITEEFFNTYKVLSKEKAAEPVLKDLNSQKLDNDQLLQLKSRLPKSGQCFMSVVTHDVDAIHNLVFNTRFNAYVHIDFSLDRLLAIKKDVKQGTELVLCDVACLPFEANTVNALFSFDYINEYDKADQAAAYEELKRVLKEDGASVVLYDKSKPLHAQSQLKSDQLSKKALSVLAPWKKKKVPTIYFHPVTVDADENHREELMTKTSFGRQFS